MNWVTGLPPGGDRSYNAFVFQRSQIHPEQCTNLYQLFGANSSFSTAYHPQTDDLAERMIQTFEEIVRIFCAYVLELKYCDGLTHDWCTILPELILAYRTSIHSSTNQTPASLKKVWNTRLPQDSLRKDLVEIHPTAYIFKVMLEKSYKECSKMHGELICICQRQMGQISCYSKLQIKLSKELIKKHPTLPVNLIKPYKSGDSESFPLRNNVPQHITPLKSSGTKKLAKVLKERKLKTKEVREYLVRYSDPTCGDKWLAEKDRPEAKKLLRRFRHTINENIT
ncbi:hypothetical protein O181_046661, partial [Austropuccinia psidii MF-1]|nr:hypothetical protein [Austropuccinia psidii MF-1]